MGFAIQVMKNKMQQNLAGMYHAQRTMMTYSLQLPTISFFMIFSLLSE